MKKTKLLIVTSLVLVIMLCSFATFVRATEDINNSTETPTTNNENNEETNPNDETIPPGDTPTPPGDTPNPNPGDGGNQEEPPAPITANVSCTIKPGYEKRAVFVTINNLSQLSGTINIRTAVEGNAFPVATTLLCPLEVFSYDASTNKCKYLSDGAYYKDDKEMCIYDLDVSLLGNNNQLVVAARHPGIFELDVGTVLDLATVTNPDTPGKDVTVDIPADSKAEVSTEYFENAKANKTDVTVKVGSQIAWEFKGSDIKDASIVFNPHVQVSNKKFDMIKNNTISKAVFVDFSHNGNLPGKAKVTLIVGTEKFGKVSRNLYLYYYNPKTNGYEYVSKVSYNRGTVTMDLKHCSTYALVENRIGAPAPAPAAAGAPAPVGALDNEPKAGEVSLLPIAMLSIISLAVTVVIKK